jgi:hypothetical protein
MSGHDVVLFLHFAGVAGLFAGIGALWQDLLQARRAALVEGLRELTPPAMVAWLLPVSALALLLTGVDLARREEAWTQAWVVTGGLSLALAVGAAMVTRMRLGMVSTLAALATPGPVPPGLRGRLDDARLWVSASVSVAFSVGALFVMTVEAGAWLSVLVLLLAGGAGVAGGALVRPYSPPDRGGASME